MFIRKRVILASTLAALFLSGCTTPGKKETGLPVPLSWPETVQQLQDLDASGKQCGKIWNLLWPWARKGHGKAAGVLADLVLLAHLEPPGVGGDGLARLRFVMALKTTAALAGDREAMKELASFHRTGMCSCRDAVASLDGDLAYCWQQASEGKNAPDHCKSAGSGLVPDLDTIVREISRLQSEENAGAVCSGPYDTLPNPLPQKSNTQPGAGL